MLNLDLKRAGSVFCLARTGQRDMPGKGLQNSSSKSPGHRWWIKSWKASQFLLTFVPWSEEFCDLPVMAHFKMARAVPQVWWSSRDLQEGLGVGTTGHTERDRKGSKVKVCFSKFQILASSGFLFEGGATEGKFSACTRRTFGPQNAYVQIFFCICGLHIFSTTQLKAENFAFLTWICHSRTYSKPYTLNPDQRGYWNLPAFEKMVQHLLYLTVYVEAPV